MQFEFVSKLRNCTCSPSGFLVSAICIQALVLFGAVYTHVDGYCRQINGELNLTKNCLEILTISLSLTSLFWLTKKLITAKYGRILAKNKHICMSICLIICLTLVLYAFIVTLVFENSSLNFGIYLLLNSATFFIASLSLVVDMIQPDHEIDEDNTDRPSISGSEVRETPRTRYERDPTSLVKEKNRRVSFANGNAKDNAVQLKWCMELENAINSNDLQAAALKVIKEIRQRSRMFSARKSEQLFTEFSYAHFCRNNERLIEED